MLAGIAGLVYVCALGFFAYAMRQPPMQFAGVMAHVGPVPFLLFPFESMWKQARRGTLQPGEQAPDFDLPLLSGAEGAGSERVRLSSFRNTRPVVLIFGSYT
jgi:hypothetical protein